MKGPSKGVYEQAARHGGKRKVTSQGARGKGRARGRWSGGANQKERMGTGSRFHTVRRPAKGKKGNHNRDFSDAEKIRSRAKVVCCRPASLGGKRKE